MNDVIHWNRICCRCCFHPERNEIKSNFTARKLFLLLHRSWMTPHTSRLRRWLRFHSGWDCEGKRVKTIKNESLNFSVTPIKRHEIYEKNYFRAFSVVPLKKIWVSVKRFNKRKDFTLLVSISRQKKIVGLESSCVYVNIFFSCFSMLLYLSTFIPFDSDFCNSSSPTNS